MNRALYLFCMLVVMLCLYGTISAPSFAQTGERNANTTEGVVTYVVKPGDTLFSIAAAHALSVGELQELNDLTDGVIRAGMELIVQKQPETSFNEPLGLTSALEEGNETLASISKQLGLSIEEILKLNPNIEGIIERLNSVETTTVSALDSYTVKAGDTMFSIAKSRGLSVEQLSDLNGLSNTSIRSGQRLKVPGSEVTQTSGWSSTGVVDAVRYPETFESRLLAGNILYDPSLFVVGHASLPIGTLIMIGKANEGPAVLCIVADESLEVSFSVLDVSSAVAEAVGLDENERIEVYTLK